MHVSAPVLRHCKILVASNTQLTNLPESQKRKITMSCMVQNLDTGLDSWTGYGLDLD